MLPVISHESTLSITSSNLIACMVLQEYNTYSINFNTHQKLRANLLLVHIHTIVNRLTITVHLE